MRQNWHDMQEQWETRSQERAGLTCEHLQCFNTERQARERMARVAANESLPNKPTDVYLCREIRCMKWHLSFLTAEEILEIKQVRYEAALFQQKREQAAYLAPVRAEQRAEQVVLDAQLQRWREFDPTEDWSPSDGGWVDL